MKSVQKITDASETLSDNCTVDDGIGVDLGFVRAFRNLFF
jgi:hypothetical protein